MDARAPAEAPLRDVTLRNVKVLNAAQTFVLENVEGLTFENVRIGDQMVNGELDWKQSTPGTRAWVILRPW